MASSESMRKRIDRMRSLIDERQLRASFEAASIAQTVLHDTVGGGHPLALTLRHALEKGEDDGATAAGSAVVHLYDEGGLQSPRLAVAHEIEGSLLDIADAQVQAAE